LPGVTAGYCSVLLEAFGSIVLAFIIACPLLGGGLLGLCASGDTFLTLLPQEQTSDDKSPRDSTKHFKKDSASARVQAGKHLPAYNTGLQQLASKFIWRTVSRQISSRRFSDVVAHDKFAREGGGLGYAISN
jgi:hypothetical protein